MGSRRFAIAAAGLACAAAIAHGASANPVVLIEWSSSSGPGTPGGSSIAAGPGDTLVAEVFISAMPGQGISAYTLTLEFDFDLGDELDLLGFFEDKPLGAILPDLPEVVTESDLSTAGSITNLDDFNLAAQFLGGGTFRIAKVTFETTGNVIADGDDVRVGAFNITDVIGTPGTILTGVTTFLGASVNIAPEPGTVGLLAFGLLGLAAATGRNGR